MRRPMKILLIVEILFGLAAGLFGPIYAIFVQQIGGNILAAGGAYSAYLFSAGILIFFLGKWEDHVKHLEKLVMLGYGLMVLAFVGYLFVQNPLHLFFVQALLGIATAINAPAYDALYSKNLEKGKSASEWAMYDSQEYITAAIGAVIGAFIADLYGFRTLFTAMAVLSFIGFLVSTRLKK